MNDKKTLLFLGGTGAMYDAVEIAKSMGIYTIVADYYPNSPAKRVADKSYLASTTDIAGAPPADRQISGHPVRRGV